MSKSSISVNKEYASGSDAHSVSREETSPLARGWSFSVLLATAGDLNPVFWFFAPVSSRGRLAEVFTLPGVSLDLVRCFFYEGSHSVV